MTGYFLRFLRLSGKFQLKADSEKLKQSRKQKLLNDHGNFGKITERAFRKTAECRTDEQAPRR